MTLEDRNKLVEDNLSLVDWTLNHKLGITQRNPHYDDYQQEGRIALIKAAETFNEDAAQFSTYAVVCIRSRIQRRRFDMTDIGRVPRTISASLPLVLSLMTGELTLEEISEKTGVSMDMLKRINDIFHPVRLDEVLLNDDGEGISLIERLVDQDSIDFDSNIIEIIHINQCVKRLLHYFKTKWVKSFISEYFNDIIQGNDVTFEEYGVKYGKTKQRCSDLAAHARRLFKVFYTR